MLCVWESESLSVYDVSSVFTRSSAVLLMGFYQHSVTFSTHYKGPFFHKFIFAVERIKALIWHLFTWETAPVFAFHFSTFFPSTFTQTGKCQRFWNWKNENYLNDFMGNHKKNRGLNDPCCYSLFTFNELFYIYMKILEIFL